MQTISSTPAASLLFRQQPRMRTDVMGHVPAVGTVRRYAKDEEIFGEGDRTAYYYKVVEGTVRTSKLLSDGRRQIAQIRLTERPRDPGGADAGPSSRPSPPGIASDEPLGLTVRELDAGYVRRMGIPASVEGGVIVVRADPAGASFVPPMRRGFVIVEINRRGVTVLLVEQNAHMALSIAKRGYVLETGRVVLEDEAVRLAANPEVQAAYLGG